VCGSEDLAFLFSLGDQYINDFVEPGHEHEGTKYPIELELCRCCSLVQMRHTAPQELLYSKHYWYRSGVTDTMQAALADVSRSAQYLAFLKPGDVVLDIGSNDGTLLRTYQRKDIFRVGVEPATNLAEEGKQGVDIFINDFWDFHEYWLTVGKRAKIITALGMFYDLEDPNKFIHDVAQALHPDGIFVAQLMCLRDTVEQGDVGNLAHEHLEFYSLASLRYLYEHNGLEIVDIEHNTVNGGSYRIYASLQESTVQTFQGAEERMERIEASETWLTDPSYYEDFLARIERNKRQCLDFLYTSKALGQSVWVYGASTKGNVILQYYGLDGNLIQGAAERSPEKWGKRTIGTGIDIFSEEDARAANPDYFLVLPYSFIEEFKVREEAWYARGGRFIVPIPEFKVI
jgi:cyclopropane fatty-acyl-phospholipid synthase-like methyltransferase